MFVSSGQFVYFSECLFIGVALGFIYLVFELIGGLIGISVIKTILDICFMVPCFFVYEFLAVKLCFPDFRPYMAVGVIIGFTLENASFNKMLAKFFLLVYNKSITKIKVLIRSRINDRRKKSEARRRRHGNVGNSISRTFDDNGIPTRNDVGEKPRNTRVAESDAAVGSRNRKRQRRRGLVASGMEDKGTRPSDRVRV